MHSVLILGAGKIGSLISVLLAHANDYEIYLADVDIEQERLRHLAQPTASFKLIRLDANHPDTIRDFLKKTPVKTVISSLPYFYNATIAKLAKEFNLNYFDLTEDTESARVISELAKNNSASFVSQCGLAPGFISIVTNHLMQKFNEIDTVKMRVGALPLNISNALQYSLTWSTDGLINEYGNLCHALENGEDVNLLPLDDLEEIKIDGLTYEAFNTSGGIGSLVRSYAGRIKHLTYKTIRYPGHCEKMRFLMNDLKLNEDRVTLKRILENAIPQTGQDVVLIYVSVTGLHENRLREENYVRKFYSKQINGIQWSAIQLTTASALCAVLDLVLSQPNKYHGLITQEQFSLDEFIKNRFGQHFA